VFTPEQILRAGIEIAKLSAPRRSSTPDNDFRRQDEICRKLRSIYFTPNGVISLIDQIIAEQTIDENLLKKTLTEFNDAEWRVDRDLSFLDFDENSDNLKLTLGTAKQLEQLRWGKVSARIAVQKVLNQFGQPNAKIDLAELKRVRKLVVELNSQIEIVEEKLNKRAK